MSPTAGVMALLAFVNVGLWTVRVALTARGRRLAGGVVAAGEAVMFALVFSNLMADLASWDRIAGYALGVAAGTVVGLAVSDRLNPGATVVEVVVAGDGGTLRQALHGNGWPATTVPAAGVDGRATMAFVAVPTNRTADVLEVVRDAVPDAFWTVRRTTAVRGSRALPQERGESKPSGRSRCRGRAALADRRHDERWFAIGRSRHSTDSIGSLTGLVAGGLDDPRPVRQHERGNGHPGDEHARAEPEA